VFGVLQSVLALMLVLGALAAPALIAAAGTRAALVITGGALPLLVALTWVRLRRIDAPREDAATRAVLLSGMDLFSALSEPTIASLAASLIPVEVPEGRVVIRQGDPPDRFYVIADGTVEVTIDGERVRTQGPGEGFGELALLRELPRTATVTAKTPVRLYSLDREPFLSAVTGHPATAAVADVLIATRLGSLAALARPARPADAEELAAAAAVSD
jgi:CRP-like cAMP-binding protein